MVFITTCLTGQILLEYLKYFGLLNKFWNKWMNKQMTESVHQYFPKNNFDYLVTKSLHR